MLGALLFLLLAGALTGCMASRLRGYELGIVAAYALLTTGIWLFTETASPLHLLNRPAALGFAGVLIAAAVAAALRSGLPLPRAARPSVAGWALISAFLVLALVAIAYPPSSWDAMAYHLTRVFFWRQYGFLAFYPTANTRQLFLFPLAEYWLLFLELLTGGDRLANAYQLLCLGVSLAALAGICRRLSAGSERLAVFFALSCPSVLLEATSTQTDLAVAAGLLAGLRLLLEDGRETLLLAALAFASAIAVKPTGAAFAPAIFAAVFFARPAWDRRRVGIGAALSAAAAALFLGPHFFRNLSTFGNALGDPAILGAFRAGDLSPAALASRFAARLASQLALPFAPWSRALEAAVGYIGAPGAVSAGGATYTEFSAPWNPLREDLANAGFLFFLLILLTPALIRSRAARSLLIPLLLSIGALGLISVWQVWDVRYVQHAYLLAAGVAAIALGALAPVPRALLRAVAISACGALALYALVFNANRPLTGAMSALHASRPGLYFTARPELARDYLEAVAVLRASPCRSFEVLEEYDSYEYPLYALVNEGAAVPARFVAKPERFEGRAINPGAELGGFTPCGRIELGDRREPAGKALLETPSVRVRLL